MDGGFEIDLKQFEDLINDLTDKEMKKVRMNAMRSGARVLKKKTDDNYKNNTNLTKRDPFEQKSKKRVVQPGKSVVSSNNKLEIVKVHIMRDYMMKWFEKGTMLRYTKKRSFKIIDGRGNVLRVTKTTSRSKPVGKIHAQWLFKQAQDQVSELVYKRIKNYISKHIDKINKKNRKL